MSALAFVKEILDRATAMSETDLACPSTKEPPSGFVPVGTMPDDGRRLMILNGHLEQELSAIPRNCSDEAQRGHDIRRCLACPSMSDPQKAIELLLRIEIVKDLVKLCLATAFPGADGIFVGRDWSLHQRQLGEDGEDGPHVSVHVLGIGGLPPGLAAMLGMHRAAGNTNGPSPDEETLRSIAERIGVPPELTESIIAGMKPRGRPN